MKSKVCLVIPVRLASERFPNKPLELFRGKSLLQNSIDIAMKLDFVNNIVVASSEDDFRVESICLENMIEFLYIKEPVSCGTEKVHYVQKVFNNYTHYMTLPVDEPTINPEELNKWFLEYAKQPFTITTLYTDFFCESDLLDTRSCKIVTGAQNNILYTSRAVIPSRKKAGFLPLDKYKKHIGVFIFPMEIADTRQYWKENEVSSLESLEQNMFLEYGFNCYKISHKGFGIDTPDQIQLLEERISTN